MTAIPITWRGCNGRVTHLVSVCVRAFVTQTNSVNTNKVWKSGWKDSGVADKVSQM